MVVYFPFTSFLDLPVILDGFTLSQFQDIVCILVYCFASRLVTAAEEAKLTHCRVVWLVPEARRDNRVGPP